MLEILLFILKLIGIILLVLLGTLLLIILIVLLAPVKYKSEGSKKDGKVNIYGLVTFLNPIIRVKICYPGETIVCVKILGVTIYPAKPKQVCSTKVDSKPEEKMVKETVAHEIKQEVKQEEKQKVQSVSTCEMAVEVDEPVQEGKQTKPKEESKKKGKKDSVLDAVEYYVSLFQENKTLILEVLTLILKTFKTILPRKCYVRVIFGTGKADITGFVYGAYCSLREKLPGEIYLEPVWTESYLEGEYFVKGKIRLIHFGIAVLRVILNKRARLLIEKLRRV